MTIKDIKWNEVTGLSQIVAIVLFVLVFAVGFLLGKTYEFHAFQNGMKAQRALSGTPTGGPIADVVFDCKDKKYIEALFWKDKVDVILSDGRHLQLPQALSASGARYANADESFVFWNKGETAFVTERNKTTYEDCVIRPIPQ